MAKNMARIEDGTVTNLEWCSDDVPETAELREYDGCSICIGDSYADGKWWRDGEEVLSDAEIAAQVAAEEATRIAAAERESAQKKEEEKLKILKVEEKTFYLIH